MSDLTGESLRRREDIRRRLFDLLGSHGYRQLDTPVLEPTELFLRKSGGELASQLFSFNDPGGRAVSLRPEFTAPAIRHFLDHAGFVDLPARWQYSGPVFRFDSAAMQDDAPPYSTQFTQVGGELLGADGLLADVELLSLALSSLSVAGVRGWTLRLADLGVLNDLLDTVVLSERARAFVVQSIPKLRGGPSAITGLMDESRRLHVVGRGSEDDHLRQAVQGLDDAEARNVLLGVLRSNPLDQLGQRRPEEVVERLLRKIRHPDAEESLHRALEMSCELAQLRGSAATVLAGASEVLRKAGAGSGVSGRLEQTIAMLPLGADGPGRVVLDFGLVRGLAYYNGIIFEVSHPDWPGALGGGGRYDGLTRDLGGTSRLPALGFAFNLDALAELAPSAPSGRSQDTSGTLVMPSNEDAGLAAFRAAASLRERGEIVELEVSTRTLGDAREYALRRGHARVISVDESGTQTSYDV